MYLEDFLEKIEAAVGHRLKRSGGSYSCRCPAHEDTNPSLSINEGADGKILLKCYAGCSVEEICSKLGMSVSELFPKQEVRQSTGSGGTEYIYKSETGRPLYKKVRTQDKRFFILSWSEKGSWEKGLQESRRVLYRLDEVLAATAREEKVWLVEGEKDAERLRIEGLVATTPIEGAGSGLRPEYVEQLSGAHVILLYDEDKAGHRRRDQWRECLLGRVVSLKIVALPGLEFRQKRGQDISDWLAMGHTVDELLALVEEVPAIAAANILVGGGLKVLTLHDFLDSEIPAREMILDPILPAQGLALLYSKRGVGKTFLSLSIAYAVAAGLPLLRWRNEKATKVLYVDGEMPANLMQERLRQLVIGAGAELPDVSYFRLVTPDLQDEGTPDIARERGQRLIEAALGDAKLLILDNLSTLAPSLQENESDAWAPIQGWLLKLRKQGMSVLVVHHANKSGGQRGTSRREDVLDSVVVLKHADGYSGMDGASFEVHIEKARGFFGEDAEPFVARLKEDDRGALVWVEMECRDDLYNEVLEGIQSGASYREIANQLQITKSKVEGIVKKARAKGDLSEVTHGS